MGDYPGLFVSFEGGDGSGKSTQVIEVANVLRSRGYDVVVSREPGGTELGAKIRDVLLHGETMNPRAEALFFAADRSHHVDTVIRPALARGAIVLEDRYTDSSVAYQGSGRELGAEEIRELSMWGTLGLVPDVTLLFDVSAEVAATRVGSKKDRLESEGSSFHEQVRSSYLSMADTEPERFRVIDGSGDVASVTREALGALDPFLVEYSR